MMHGVNGAFSGRNFHEAPFGIHYESSAPFKSVIMSARHKSLKAKSIPLPLNR